jgi:hypothetical protein
MTIKPAAGPLIVNSELLRNGVSIPPTIAVKIPAIGGTPEATEMPRHSGKAIKKTRRPDAKSFDRCSLNPVKSPTGLGPEVAG